MCHGSSSVEQCNEAFSWIRNMISDVMENELLHQFDLKFDIYIKY